MTESGEHNFTGISFEHPSCANGYCANCMLTLFVPETTQTYVFQKITGTQIWTYGFKGLRKRSHKDAVSLSKY